MTPRLVGSEMCIRDSHKTCYPFNHETCYPVNHKISTQSTTRRATCQSVKHKTRYPSQPQDVLPVNQSTTRHNTHSVTRRATQSTTRRVTQKPVTACHIPFLKVRCCVRIKIPSAPVFCSVVREGSGMINLPALRRGGLMF